MEELIACITKPYRSEIIVSISNVNIKGFEDFLDDAPSLEMEDVFEVYNLRIGCGDDTEILTELFKKIEPEFIIRSQSYNSVQFSHSFDKFEAMKPYAEKDLGMDISDINYYDYINAIYRGDKKVLIVGITRFKKIGLPKPAARPRDKQ